MFWGVAGGARKQERYKILNDARRDEMVINCFLLLFQRVVWVQVFLYRRRKRIFLEGN